MHNRFESQYNTIFSEFLSKEVLGRPLLDSLERVGESVQKILAIITQIPPKRVLPFFVKILLDNLIPLFPTLEETTPQDFLSKLSNLVFDHPSIVVAHIQPLAVYVLRAVSLGAKGYGSFYLGFDLSLGVLHQFRRQTHEGFGGESVFCLSLVIVEKLLEDILAEIGRFSVS